MATNPYVPYNPLQVGQAAFQPYQQPMWQMPQPQKQSEMLWVQGEAGAKAYQLAPNSRVVLWDQDNPTIYIKTSDASGMTSIRTLDYTERGQEPKNDPLGMNSETEYVTKEDFASLEDRFQRQLNRLSTQLNNMRNKKEAVDG